MSSSDTQLITERSTGIGGTDAAALINKNPWKSAVDVYLEKTQTSPKHNSKKSPVSELKLQVGNELEKLVVKLFEERMDMKVQTNIPLKRHRKFPYLLAHVDGLIGEDIVFEAKTCGMNAILSRSWGNERDNLKAEIEDVPYQYYAQLQWYLMIFDRKIGYLAVLMGGNEDFRVYRYERDYELGIILRKAAKKFWTQNVLKNIAPPPMTLKDASNIHQRHTDAFKKATPQMEALVNKAKSVRAQMKKLFSQKEILDSKICDFIGDNEGLINERKNTIATWKENKAGKRLLRLF